MSTERNDTGEKSRVGLNATKSKVPLPFSMYVVRL